MSVNIESNLFIGHSNQLAYFLNFKTNLDKKSEKKNAHTTELLIAWKK